MYKALFAISFYGLLRIGEVTYSTHVIKAKNVHMAINKEKLLLILYLSKTHDEGVRPQKIKIVSNRKNNDFLKKVKLTHSYFCPFILINNYIAARGCELNSENEQFFVLSNGSPLMPVMARNLLKKLIANLGLDDRLYNFHSFRIGRSSDLIKFGYSVEEVKRIGRWHSNAVYKYIRV